MTNIDDTLALKEAIRRAAQAADALAITLVPQILASDIPPEHWDEVIAKLRDLLAKATPAAIQLAV